MANEVKPNRSLDSRSATIMMTMTGTCVRPRADSALTTSCVCLGSGWWVSVGDANGARDLRTDLYRRK